MKHPEFSVKKLRRTNIKKKNAPVEIKSENHVHHLRFRWIIHEKFVPQDF